MIPKIIHYCWFGPREFPEDSKLFIDEWKQLHPDFTFMFWNEENVPNHSIITENIASGKYAFASDYLRLWALYEYGGVYLDVDFELLKSLHPLLVNNCFVGFQYTQMGKFAINNGIMGACKKHHFIYDCLISLERHGHSAFNPYISPELTTSVLTSYGLSQYAEQILNDVKIYTKEFFYPKSYEEHLRGEAPEICHNTMAIHHFHGSWIEYRRKPNRFFYFFKICFSRFLILRKMFVKEKTPSA